MDTNQQVQALLAEVMSGFVEGRRDEARARLGEALALAPEDPRVRSMVGRLFPELLRAPAQEAFAAAGAPASPRAPVPAAPPAAAPLSEPPSEPLFEPPALAEAAPADDDPWDEAEVTFGDPVDPGGAVGATVPPPRGRTGAVDYDWTRTADAGPAGLDPDPWAADADAAGQAEGEMELTYSDSGALELLAEEEQGAAAGASLPLDSEAGEDDLEARRAEAANLLEGARELFELADFTGSLELLEKVLEMDPDNAEAKAYLARNEVTLVQMYESRIGSTDLVPRVVIQPDEVVWLSMDHRAGFILAQIDGTVSYDDLFSLSGMSRLDTCKVLVQLLDEGVIEAE